MNRIAAAVLCACTLLALPACTSPVPVGIPPPQEASSLQATYAALAQAGGKVMAIHPEASTVRIYAFRGGRAARLGHNHVLSAPRFTGFFYLPDGGAAASRFDLEFRLDELQIDDPAARAGLGEAFESVPSADAIAGTREHMLGEENLQAARFPFVRIHALEISGEAPRFAARVRVEMHGQSREMWVPLVVEGLPERLQVSGSFVLRQTDFGVAPYSVGGGLLSVKDEVVVDFRLAGS